MTEKFSKNSINQPRKSLCTFVLRQTWTHKNFVKAMDQNGVAFMCLRNKFPRTPNAKIKENVFVGTE